MRVDGPSPRDSGVRERRGIPGSLFCPRNPRRTFQELQRRRPERKKDSRSRRPCTSTPNSQTVDGKEEVATELHRVRGSQSRAVWPRGEPPTLQAPPPAFLYRGGREVAHGQIWVRGSGRVSTQSYKGAALSSQSVSAGFGSLRQDLPSRQAIGG